MFSKRLNLEIDFKIISCAHRSIFSSRNDWGRLPRHGGKICSMIRKYWLENSSLNINYWRKMRSLSCSSCYLPLAPTHSPVKLFWGISLLFMWRVYDTLIGRIHTGILPFSHKALPTPISHDLKQLLITFKNSKCRDLCVPWPIIIIL